MIQGILVVLLFNPGTGCVYHINVPACFKVSLNTRISTSFSFLRPRLILLFSFLKSGNSSMRCYSTLSAASFAVSSSFSETMVEHVHANICPKYALQIIGDNVSVRHDIRGFLLFHVSICVTPI